MAGLDDVFSGLTQAASDFSSKYYFPNTGDGQALPPGGTQLTPDEGGNFSKMSFGDYGISPTAVGNVSYDFNKPLYDAGYDLIDPRQVGQVAQKNFGGDTMAALKYRYGDDATFSQDKRFAPYDATGQGLFAKPTDASRLGMGGVDFAKYPLWQLPDSQPGLLQGALGGDWPLTKIAGLVASGGASFPGFAAGQITGNSAIGQLVNLAGGNLGGGGVDIGDGVLPQNYNLPTGMPLQMMSDLGGGGGGTDWISKAISDSTLPNTPGSMTTLGTGAPFDPTQFPNLMNPGAFDYNSADTPGGASSFSGGPSGSASIFGDGPSPAGAPSFAQSVLSKFGGASGINGALGIGSGLYGLYQAYQQKKKLEQLTQQADPWGASGGRAAAGQQLQQFQADPTGAAAADPSYALRIQAAARAAAPYGQGSGKMAVDAANASTSWYNDRLQQLAGLAGTGNGIGAGSLNVQGTANNNALLSSSLGSIGYGANTLSGGTGMNPQILAYLLQKMGGGANP